MVCPPRRAPCANGLLLSSIGNAILVFCIPLVPIEVGVFFRSVHLFSNTWIHSPPGTRTRDNVCFTPTTILLGLLCDVRSNNSFTKFLFHIWSARGPLCLRWSRLLRDRYRLITASASTQEERKYNSLHCFHPAIVHPLSLHCSKLFTYRRPRSLLHWALDLSLRELDDLDRDRPVGLTADLKLNFDRAENFPRCLFACILSDALRTQAGQAD